MENVFFILLLCYQVSFCMTTEYKRVGCFSNHDSLETLSNETFTDPLLTHPRCLARCSRQWHLYFTLAARKVCACFGDVLNLKDYNASDQCNSPCMGDTLKECGGKHSVEIFKITYCNDLLTPLNGYLEQTLKNATFGCKHGYKLQGSDLIHCNKTVSKWDGPMNPFCQHTHGTSPFYLTSLILVCFGIVFLLSSFLFIRRKYEEVRTLKATFHSSKSIDEPYVYMSSKPKRSLNLITEKSGSSASGQDLSQQDISKGNDSTKKRNLPLEDANLEDNLYVSHPESVTYYTIVTSEENNYTKVSKLEGIDEEEIY